MRALVTASTLALLALTPGAASAAQVSWDSSTETLSFVGEGVEENRLTVTQSGGAFTFTDLGAPVGTGSGDSCSSVSASQVRCTPDSDARVRVEVLLGDSEDTATLNTTVRADASGGNGSDVLTGGSGLNRLDGGNGPDLLRGSVGDDDLVGGNGHDTADYSGSQTPVVLQPAGGADETAAHDHVDDVEVLIGGDAADRLTAPAVGADLIGGPGDDALLGGAGPDGLDGGAGIDSFSGGGGNDRIASRDGAAERVSCADGIDTVTADREDEIAADCETVDLPFAPGAPTAADPAAGSPVGAGGSLAADGSAPALPRPVVGRRVTVRVASGTVLVRSLGRKAFAALTGAASIATGSVIDARRGSLTLTAASNTSGATQTASFRGGMFSVTQTKGPRPITELALRGGNFSGCRPKASGAATTSAARKPVRSLFGSGHGRFRTRGRGSVATVRGTVWIVADRCDGTLTTVRRGVVEVRDLARKRTVLVRAGQRYFAARAAR